MKFTLSWLKQFLETSATINEISGGLTTLGLEVEEIIDKSVELQNFEVAHIINAKPHPSADKLQICQVQTKEGIIQIVCGAGNARANIKVVLAKIGTEIPNGKFKIKESTIRGEKSYGMLCSEEELLISSSSEGIIELPEDAIVGEVFTKYYGLNDPVFVINVTPNRGDTLGVYGIARDLAAKGIGGLKELEIPIIKSDFSSKTKMIVNDKEACPLFTFREIKNLKNNPSPDWLQKLLKSIGIKPISSIVDVTNYISYSFGQPMHAYDADKLEGDIIIVVDYGLSVLSLRGDLEEATRQSCELKSFEIAMQSMTARNDDLTIKRDIYPRNDDSKTDLKFRALNDKEYILNENDLVVKDKRNIQALAGIIGGIDSSCNSNTANILLEAACFNAKLVASSGRKLQIDTDSRYRFERNIDRNFTEKALDIATNLILSICGGKASEITIIGEKEPVKKSLDFSAQILERITGIKLNINDIEVILNNLGFTVNIKNDILNVTPPSWRHDINIIEDIAEEVARIYGYDKIETIKLPDLEQGNNKVKSYKKISTFKRMLASRGYDEVVTNSFINSADAKLFSEIKEELFLLNPISIEDNYMRPTILPNLLNIAKKNLTRSIKDVTLFEVGPVFIDLNTEMTCLTAIMTGLYSSKNPHSQVRIYDIFDLKSDLEQILDYTGLSIDKCLIASQAVPSYYHPTRSVNILLGKNLLGYFGQIHPKILKHYDLNQEVFAFELNITNLPTTKSKFGKREEFTISDFQTNFRDYAFTVDSTQQVGEIISYINNFNKKLVKSVALFDIYSGDKLPAGKKSIAIKVELQADDRTLTEADLSLFSKDLVAGIEQKFQGILRE